MDEADHSMSEVDLIRTIFEGKWRFDIIQKVCERPQRLSNLERSIPTATKKMLIDTLHALEQLGWITRSDLSTEDLKHIEYALTKMWESRLRFAVQKIGLQEDARSGEDSPDTN